ncbi:putative anti-sigma-YlaC factor YlaD [Caldalkalibacillus uzonensis]|uniref:Anti-sigma-YlaC factor YlaD n=1 Tax=Caldalkalibacillus uzonensis TaxID=353224 RepID=A0ABU0CQC1_9BACI|nr:zf-HC2 domain-containing protein [Caldalkalibacillus uzonensis]MDQ0338352.1 putative anti-sigma-YlaC factor YlaD [Caldalkalibacillus uzonensis]
MKCSLVRDLLPLYREENCRPETIRAVEKHLNTCPHCHKLYKALDQPLKLKSLLGEKEAPLNVDTAADTEPSNLQQREFWRRYYGRYLVKGSLLFLVLYLLLVAGGKVFS